MRPAAPSAAQFLFLVAVNLYVNVYPIFLQRYNRFRLRRMLGGQER